MCSDKGVGLSQAVSHGEGTEDKRGKCVSCSLLADLFRAHLGVDGVSQTGHSAVTEAHTHLAELWGGRVLLGGSEKKTHSPAVRPGAPPGTLKKAKQGAGQGRDDLCVKRAGGIGEAQDRGALGLALQRRPSVACIRPPGAHKEGYTQPCPHGLAPSAISSPPPQEAHLELTGLFQGSEPAQLGLRSPCPSPYHHLDNLINSVAPVLSLPS